jgi:hypothetical protein
LPHKLSEYGPALAAGDIDGNGLDDMVAGGNTFAPPVFFLQQPGGKFSQKIFLNKNGQTVTNAKDEGMLLFDANGDGSLDLYIASGGINLKATALTTRTGCILMMGRGILHLLILRLCLLTIQANFV